MRWSESELLILKEQSELGVSDVNISKILGRSVSSVKNKSTKLGLKSLVVKEVYEDIFCKNCGIRVRSTIMSKRRFCSRTCSVSFNNRLKVVSDNTKSKISKSLLNRDFVRKSPKVRVCKSCNLEIKKGSVQQYCDECRYTYYELYRPSCKFKFNPLSFPEWLDCDLILKHGRYSPSNKGNNLKGVSLDHMYSVKDGFINNISPDIISHPANCKIMFHNENSSKHSNSSISIDELLLRIENFNETYSSSFPTMSLQNS